MRHPMRESIELVIAWASRLIVAVPFFVGKAVAMASVPRGDEQLSALMSIWSEVF